MTQTIAPWQIAVTGLCGLALAMGVGRFAYTPLLPMMQDDLAMSLQTGSWLAFANMLGYLLGGLTGRFLTTLPVRHVRWAALIVVVSLFGMAWTQQPWLWVTWRLIAGVASAWIMILVSLVCLPRLVGAPRLPGLVYAGVGSGIVLSGGLCAVFVAMGWSSTAAWVSLGGVSVLLAWPLWRVFQRSWDTRSQPKESTAAKTAQPHKSPPKISERRLWILVVCYGLYGFGYILPATYLPAQARLLLQDGWSYSLAWPLFGIAAAGSTLIASLIAFRLGLLRAWLLAQIILTIGVLTPIVWTNMTGIVVACLCVGGTFVVITLLAMQLAQTSASGRTGLWMARFTTAFAVGQVLGPTAIVWLQGELIPGLWLAALTLLVSTLALGWQCQQERRLTARC